MKWDLKSINKFHPSRSRFDNRNNAQRLRFCAWNWRDIMKTWLPIATISAFVLTMMAVFALPAPAQARDYDNLIAQKRQARIEYIRWDREYEQWRHQVNDLYRMRDRARHNRHRWHGISRRIDRVEAKRDYAGRQARYWNQEYQRLSRLVNRWQRRDHGPRISPAPRRYPDRRYERRERNNGFGISLYDRKSGFSIQFGGG
jgi:hypothetical protein